MLLSREFICRDQLGRHAREWSALSQRVSDELNAGKRAQVWIVRKQAKPQLNTSASESPGSHAIMRASRAASTRATSGYARFTMITIARTVPDRTARYPHPQTVRSSRETGSSQISTFKGNGSDSFFWACSFGGAS